MAMLTRVLDDEPVRRFDDYARVGGGRALATAAQLAPSDVVELVAAAGLRGRGGAGFPTGLKWRTVAANAAGTAPVTVVVNAAEGEPGTFKDRELIRRNPYRVLEGALVAAYAMTAPRVVVAIKGSFTTEIERMDSAIAEMQAAGVATDITIDVVRGPDEYLFGEETALLEVVDGRHPFPRVVPPYRRGVEPHDDTPALVDNVETLANVPGIIAEGPEWFRRAGTPASPGTIVCTVSGDTVRHGVGEFEMGTPLAEVIETVGRGPLEGRHVVAAMLGTANAMLLADQLDTPMSYEAMASAGTGLGTGGIIVFDDSRDLLDVGRAVSHFLAIESCGQCEPCKFDGQTIAAGLRDLVSGRADEATTAEIRHRVGSVGRGARCALARQHEAVISDLLVRCRDEFDAHVDVDAAPSNPVVIAPIVELVDGRFVLDDDFLRKQPDWSHDDVDSGETPVDRLGSAPVLVGAPHGPGERAGSGKEPRDPFAALLALHDIIRDDLDAALATDGEPGQPVSDLAEHLTTEVEIGDRLIYPMVERVTTAADDAVWSAELHGLDALAVASALEPSDRPDGHRLDRLARDVRRHLDDNERIVYPLLRLHLDEAEQTNLADAVDEMLAAPQR